MPVVPIITIDSGEHMRMSTILALNAGWLNASQSQIGVGMNKSAMFKVF